MSRDWFKCDEDLQGFHEQQTESQANKKRRSIQGKLLMVQRTGRIADQVPSEDEADVEEIAWTSSDEDEPVNSSFSSKRKNVKRKRKSFGNKSQHSTSYMIEKRNSSNDQDDKISIASNDESLDSSDVALLHNDDMKKCNSTDDRKCLSAFEIPDIDSEDSRSSLMSSQRDNQKTEEKTQSPIISSQMSSSTSFEKSPKSDGMTKLKASEWIKSLNFKTPTKDSQPIISTEDSAKKRKKYLRGGFADQLSGIISREKSSYSVWKHKMTSNDAKSSSKSLLVKVERMEPYSSLQLSYCKVISPENHPTTNQVVMFSSVLWEQLEIETGSVVEISPPWQELQLKHCHQSLLLCTNFSRVVSASTDNMGVPHSAPAEKKATCYYASWKCPCVTGLVTSSSKCLATQLPCFPGFSTSEENTSDSEPLEGDTSSLHVITATQISTQKQCSSTDSVLEWVDKRHSSPDLQLKGTVLRVIRKRVSMSTDSLSLLLQDSHNAVCLVNTPEDIAQGDNSVYQEGEVYMFSGLDVVDRTNPDRNPALFSLIHCVWCQSESSVQVIDSQGSLGSLPEMVLPVSAPGFCYILKENTLVGYRAQLYDKTEEPKKDLRREDECLHNLADVYKVVPARQGDLGKRVSLKVDVIYRLDKKHLQDDDLSSPQNNFSQTQCVVYVTDDSLVAMETSYMTVKVSNSSTVITSMSPSNHVTIRDVYVDRDLLYCDMYSSVSHVEDCHHQFMIQRLHIPTLSIEMKAFRLCTIEGTIEEVHEDSAYSWDVCDQCQSDNLAYRDNTQSGALICMKCQHNVETPLTKMKLTVGLRCVVSHQAFVVKLELHQNTIETLLPDKQDEEGYDIACVLQKHLGPLTCIIIKNQSSRKERSPDIHLLEIN